MDYEKPRVMGENTSDLKRRGDTEMTSYEWKMGDPCPVCGAKIPPTHEMISHARTHAGSSLLMFIQRVLYFDIQSPLGKAIK